MNLGRHIECLEKHKKAKGNYPCSVHAGGPKMETNPYWHNLMVMLAKKVDDTKQQKKSFSPQMLQPPEL